MDTQELERIWADVCARVKTYENINPSQVDGFFTRLHPQAAAEGFLMLTTEAEFVKTWIEQHYIGFIKMALEELHGVPFTVVIEVFNPSAAAAAPAQAAGSPASEDAAAPQQGAAGHAAPTAASAPAPAVAPAPEAAMAPGAPSQEDEPQPTAAHPASTYTFENYVIGDSNRMAYSMAVAVAESPGKTHLNPLFIYGKSGLGKTHLLCAIQSYVNETMPNLRTVYVDSSELVNEYMEASTAHDKEKSSFKNFKTRYEEADVLLIDDVQALQGKKQTLDIVFQIFNKLTRQGRQVVLAADRAPKNIDIDERYKSRFNSGGTYDIQPPEIETKLGIVKAAVEEYRTREGIEGFDLPRDVQMYIAESSSSNIRELKSAVTKVIWNMTLRDQTDTNIDEVRTLLENHFSGGPTRRLSIADIQKQVEEFYKVTHADLVGKKRARNIAHARHVAIYLCRQMLDLPYNDIGKRFDRDHATVMHSVGTIERKMGDNRELYEEIEALRQIILDL